jgi:hypothetical protein
LTIKSSKLTGNREVEERKKENMKGVLDAENIRVWKITPDDEGQYFFGYYDNRAFNSKHNVHLCHKVKFMDRLPQKDDICELGMIDLESCEYTALTTTKSWNFQQGAMLQWNPMNLDEYIYNDYIDGKYCSIIKNIDGTKEQIIDRPIACVSPNGKWGLSINFSRIYDFRPGYGYCNEKDPYFDTNVPDEDGIFLVNMKNGKSQMIASYTELDRLFCSKGQFGKEVKLSVNHITFNKESDRFVFLMRNLPDKGEMWLSAIGTGDLAGNIYKLRPYTFGSHYCWGKNNQLMIYGDCNEGTGLYFLKDLSQDYDVSFDDMFTRDIHCNYSPDEQWVLGDGYPDSEVYNPCDSRMNKICNGEIEPDKKQCRPVYLYHVPSRKGMMIGRFYSPNPPSWDIRCDLHCRWNDDGVTASFDSIHEGKRAIYMMDLTKAMEHILKM